MNVNLITPGFFGREVPADSRRIEFDALNEQLLYLNKKIDYLFIGDSITHRWELNAYFKTDKLLVNRGIGGDHSEFLIRRFDADCVQLKPEYAVIMIGINDIFRTHPDWRRPTETEEEVLSKFMNNIHGMVQKCKENGIIPVLCSVLPSKVEAPYNCEVRWKLTSQMNEFLKSLGEIYVDYHSALAYNGVSMSPEITPDGVHVNAKGYKIMAETLKKYVEL